MKNLYKQFGIIALTAVIGFSMAACGGDDDSTGDGGGGGINVSQLPEFPSGSTPAGTKAVAETIMAELRRSPILDSIQEELWEVIDENVPRNGNYSFSNKSLPGGSVKVSASGTGNETNTGGFQTLSANRKARNELYDAIDALYNTSPVNYTEIDRLYDEAERLEEARDAIQFASGNKASGTYVGNAKGELTRAQTEGGVTVAPGSILERKENGSENVTVTTAGTYRTFRISGTQSEKERTMASLTVTTSSGSVKIILDMTAEWSETGNNVKYYYDDEDDIGTITETEKYSGSLHVYGSNNALLIDHRVVDRESFDMAQYMISYDPYSFNPASATPLTNNVKVNGNISSGDSTALYSINVTSGTTYHLWWDDSDTDWNMMDVRVRGYSGNGILFFDMNYSKDSDWGNYYSFTATSTGTVYIMVYPYDEYETGTFSIVYNTTGSRPAMSVSFAAPPSANSRSVQNKTDSVVKPKKAAEVLRHKIRNAKRS
jgi:hypothetical protein